MNDHDKPYWANAEPETLAEEMQSRIKRYYEHVKESGRLAVWAKADALYYGGSDDGISSIWIEQTGDQGEQLAINDNQFRSIVRHAHNLVTGTRPYVRAQASNMDGRSLTQRRLAEGVFDHYWQHEDMEAAFVDADLLQLRAGDAWIFLGWDFHAGKLLGMAPVEGVEGLERPVYEGDVRVRLYHPIDVVRDVHAPDPHYLRWAITQRPMGRHDLLALYPEHYDAICGASAIPEVGVEIGYWHTAREQDREDVPVWELWHRPTPACPKGRYALMVGDTVLEEGELPPSGWPLIEHCPDAETKRPFGFGDSWSICALQDAVNSLVSTLVSNADAFGIQTMFTDVNNPLEVEDIADGLRLIKGTSQPVPLQLLQPNEGTYKLADLLIKHAQQHLGLNDVARGDVSGVSSGSMAALVQSMAVQFNSGRQRSWNRAIQRGGTQLVRTFQAFATTERVIDVVGERGRVLSKALTGADISDVSRIIVETSSPFLASSEGRKAFATEMMQFGVIKDPQQVLAVATTGRLEPITDRAETQVRNAAAENDRLVKGEPALVLLTDDHARHLDAHLAILDEPEVRENKPLAEHILDHVQTHIDQWTQLSAMNPALLLATGQQPLPVPPPMGAPMPGGPAPEGPPQGPPNPSGPQPNARPEAPVDVPPPPAAEQAGTDMPTMPINPATGERFNPETGGL